MSCGMKKLREEFVSSSGLAGNICTIYRHYNTYNMGCHLRTNKLNGAHTFQLIQCRISVAVSDLVRVGRTHPPKMCWASEPAHMGWGMVYRQKTTIHRPIYDGIFWR